MLLRFSVKNYRSFRDEQELSLVASSAKEHPTSVIQTKAVDQGVLPVAAIYGPNASGKSNLLRALEFMVRAVEHSHRSWKPDGGVPSAPFLLAQRANEPTEFRLDFVAEDVRFQYGFSHDAIQILTEWLYSYPSGKKQTWFEREAEQFRFGKSFLGANRAIEGTTRKNSLFMSAAAQSNHEKILPLFAWLTSSIRFLIGNRIAISNESASKLAKAAPDDQLVRLLSGADLGIVGVSVKQEPIDERIAEAMDDMVKRISLVVQVEQPVTPFRAPRESYVVSFNHRGKDNTTVPIASQFESAGTIAFLALLERALETIGTGGVLCVDELDASLHPMLALEVVRLFTTAKPKSPFQLVFNTHDVNLLDQTLLRRDEIWFTEKDNEGATHLYSLQDFAPRKHENLKRGYLQGRFGAVPYLGTFTPDFAEKQK